MKKIFFKLSLLIGASFVSLSCDNRLLDVEDPSKVSEKSATSTLGGIEKINNGFYAILPTVDNWYIQSLITDELVINIEENLGGGTGFYGWSYSPGTVADRDGTTEVFRRYYNAIRRTNLVINSIDNIAIENRYEEKKKLLKAEALGLRAYAHFQVLQLFSPKYGADELGVPYVTGVDDFALPARDDMKTSYDNILRDLEESSVLFASISMDNENHRMNKYAVEALKAKVYLEIGEYKKAIEFADKVLNGGYSLVTADKYLDVWADKNDYKEVIFKQKNTAEASSSDSGILFENSGGQIQYNASASLRDKYKEGDIRNSLFLDKGERGYIPLKYLKPYFDGVKSKKGRADIKLIRTSEIILLRAEAYARDGDLAKSLEDYKKVRDARNAGASEAFTSREDALDKILEERDRELSYEGFRLLDIKRFEKNIVRSQKDVRPPFTTLENLNINQYTLPIPFREVFANKNIQQNKGW